MAVFTPVSLQDLTPWISSFSLGSVSNIRGISSGIENSNFFVSTEKGEYVLTLFEKLTFDELPFYLNLMQHLARKGIKVPAPVPDKNGRILHSLHGKPACLVTKLVGDWQPEPEALHCAQVGDMMAKMHLAGQDYSLQQPNPRGLEWWKKTVPLILSYLPVKTSFMLQDELRFQEEFASTNLYWKLYRGPIHADLFRNNVMFDSTRLTCLMSLLPSMTGVSIREPENWIQFVSGHFWMLIMPFALLHLMNVRPGKPYCGERHCDSGFPDCMISICHGMRKY